MKKLNIENIKADKRLIHPGVYKIFLFKNEKPITIQRFLENDDSGLVYIGAAGKTNLAYRLTCFMNSKRPDRKQNNHSGGKKIKVNKRLSEFASELIFYYEVIKTKDAKEKERDMLKNYFMKFGEVPPLNG